MFVTIAVAVSDRPIHAALIDTRNSVLLSDQEGNEVGKAEIPYQVGKFLIAQGRDRPGVKKTGESTYKIRVEYSPDEAAGLVRKWASGVSALFKLHEGFRLMNRSRKMLQVIGQVTHYEPSNVPAIPGLVREPTMYQLQNALWMSHVEGVLPEIHHSHGYRLTQNPRNIRTAAPAGMRADYHWSPEKGSVMGEIDPFTHRLRGGMLLDEAGVGKTMSALMHGYFNNRYTGPTQYIQTLEEPVPDANNDQKSPTRALTKHTETELVMSSATLIVTRNHLVKQWEGEIRDVFGSFRTPTDVGGSGPRVITLVDGRAWKKVYAAQIADADFIILSYEFLTGNNTYNTMTFPPRSLRSLTGFRDHIRAGAAEMSSSPALSAPMIHGFHFNRVIYDEIQNLYSTASGRSLLGQRPTDTVHGAIRAANITATYRWGLSASAFNNENDVLNILCLLSDQTGMLEYSYPNYTPLISHYRDWSHLLFRRNTRESIIREIPMRKVTRNICRIAPTQAEMKIYNSIRAGQGASSTATGNQDLRMFCACPRLTDATAELSECGSIDDVARGLFRKYETQIAEQKRELQDRELKQRETFMELKDHLRGQNIQVSASARCLADIQLPPGFEIADQYVAQVYNTVRNTLRGLETQVENTRKKLDQLNNGLRYMKEEVIGAIDREEVKECIVCCEEFSETLPINVTKCGHMFCGPCIQETIKNTHKCPNCKTEIRSKSDIYVISTPEEMTDLLKTLGSKVAVLVSFLNRIIRDTDENVIVFSEWDNLLQYAGNLLNKAGIRTLFMRGNAAAKNITLRKFTGASKDKGKEDEEDYRVLMLSSKKSAEGTNLTKATRIVFMDPIYGEDRELVVKQAIGRSMRMNQKRDIEVTNLIMKGTVEEEEIGNLESGLIDVEIDIDNSIELDNKPVKKTPGLRKKRRGAADWD